MVRDLVLRHAHAVPRYTSYPTAPHFSKAVQAEQYRRWLAALPEEATLSLYLHVPFCRSLCWYCGCTTKATNRYEPVKTYLDVLEQEIVTVAALVPKGCSTTHVHWGGGSPNMLSAADIGRLGDRLREGFAFAAGAEVAVEIDPRWLEPAQVTAFARAGVNRVSIGVQDFDPAVQRAINREQSCETTRRAVDMFRKAGVASVNIDLVYGLPHQTRSSLARTIEDVLAMRPDRVAIFGYAHLPSRLKHQQLIDEATLPDTLERYAQSQRAARLLEAAGYVRVGLDHFALPSDSLAQGRVRRNFQGYTTDGASALIGLGTSAIGHLPQGYVQNASTVGEYAARIRELGLATVRGAALTPDDRLRGHVIESLMCTFAVSASELRRAFGGAAEEVLAEAQSVADSDADGLFERTEDVFRVTPKGRPFVRAICACFDRYLENSPAQHALAV